MNENLEFLQSQFELVGDDPLQKATESTHQLLKQSEYNYTLWCSGRQCCEGMLVDIKVLNIIITNLILCLKLKTNMFVHNN